MDLVILILILVAIMVLGATAPKPFGWIAIGFSVLALLLKLLGSPGRFGAIDTDAPPSAPSFASQRAPV